MPTFTLRGASAAAALEARPSYMQLEMWSRQATSGRSAAPPFPPHLYILMLFLPQETSWVCPQGTNFSACTL
jgi:hypothetical protein